MRTHCFYAQVAGALLGGIGVVGLFAGISSDDGALAITGALVFGSGLLSRALLNQKRDGGEHG